MQQNNNKYNKSILIHIELTWSKNGYMLPWKPPQLMEMKEGTAQSLTQIDLIQANGDQVFFPGFGQNGRLLCKFYKSKTL